MCGELIVPPDTITSRLARTSVRLPPRWKVTPTQRLPSNSSLPPCASVSTRRLGRPLASRRKVCAVEPRRRAAPRHLRIADALALLAVEIGIEREARLLRGFDEAMGERQDGAVVLDLERPALAAHLGIAALHVVLGLLEVGQHVVVAPAAAAHLRPAVEIGRRAAHIEHAVDRARAAHDAAARPFHAPLAVPFSGSVVKFQLTSGFLISERMPAGIWIIGCQSLGPASSRITDAPVSDRRDATTHPAEPAPTTT